MTPGLRRIALLVAALLPCSAAALPLDRVYALDRLRSILQVCEVADFSCRGGVVGTIRLSIDGDDAALEVIWFDVLPRLHEAIHRLPGDEVWSGVRAGSVLAPAGELTQVLFSFQAGDIEATILAELSSEAVHFTGGDSRGYTYDFWGAAVPEPGAELLLAALLAIGVLRASGPAR